MMVDFRATVGASGYPPARARRFLNRALSLAGGKAEELSVVVCGDARMRSLNRRYRGKDRTTDVLSFPAGPAAGGFLGDLVISTGSVRLETTTNWFVHEGYPAVASYEAVLALEEAATRLGYRHHVGITATAPGFFGAQGRPIPQLPIRYPDLADEMSRQGILNFEMEASAVLVLAGLGGGRAGVVCAVYANRRTGEFVTGGHKDRAEAAVVETGLESLLILAELDRQKAKAGAARWRPSLWAPE